MSKSVGYKKPPQHTRWTKGQSGNPTGRAKGQRNLKTDLATELAEFMQITEGGVPKRITKQRAVIKALTAKAINGDPRAVQLILELVMSIVEPGSPPDALTSLSAQDEALIEAAIASKTSALKGDKNG